MKKGAKKEKNMKVKLNQKSSPEMVKQQSNTSPGLGKQWPFSYVVSPQPELSLSTAAPPKNLVFQDFLGGTLPRHDHDTPSSSNQQATASMTIFYSGGVHFFNDISPEKMANQSKTTEAMNETINALTDTEILSPNMQIPPQNLAPSPSPPPPDNFFEFYGKGALAMARKATLARFLEKRKHRLIYAASPYSHPVGKSSNNSPQAPKNALEFNFMLPEEEETSSSAVDLESRCSTSIL
ncbi:protein JAZ7-like isoform X2 [Ipomoea triloba]|uniref:protein JAZ7-like isoform X2 n=1 Tax=Ipomoea triloba TaxID=35885 RepID=UPI00125E8D43|nr:protein JAZ7-like isoform X2 [Ipomoea triloba]